jgi:NAD(P)-dependent dehydrogenase (short-subunit alcohol dehydrogenase family)
VSSIDSQFLNITEHHSLYSGIDPSGALSGSAAGRTVFISGASQGIGRATAVAFARAGASSLFITARTLSALEETRELVRLANPDTECACCSCDVTDALQVKAAVDDCVACFGGIDVADANAGCLGPWLPFADSDPESWWRSWEVNVKGAYLVARYTLPHLIRSACSSSGGYLIMISSVGAQLLMPGASDYQASKHAINRLCEFVNVDHGNEGIKCFAVHPGGVDTSLARNMPEAVHPYLTDEPELAGGFCVWLCSGAADWATGRYLSSTWDVGELLEMKDAVLGGDLLVNRLRTKG